MIKLNSAILDYNDERAMGISKLSHGIRRRKLKRRERKIHFWRDRLMTRNWDLRHLIADHISGTLNELSAERREFGDHLLDKRFTELGTLIGLTGCNRELLDKITFATYAHGRNRANCVLEGLIGGTNETRHSLAYELRRIDKYKIELSNRCPVYAGDIDRFVSENIALSQENREIKLEREYRPFHARFDERAVVNLTNVEIPEDVLLILSFGPKFCFPPKNDLLSTIRFLDDFCGHLEGSFSIETHFEAYRQLSIEMNKITRFSKQTREIWLDFLNYRVMKFKRLYPDVFIARSDKGKHTVIIHKTEYTDKMNSLVLSTDDYVPINDVNIDLLEKKNNKFVELLINRKVRGAETCFDNCTFVAQMYGLIKVHKTGYPIRPITAACAAPGFTLAKLFTSIISEVFFEDGFHVRNSSSFVERLMDLNLKEFEQMISFDVISMFTNIPIDHMIELISERKDEIFSTYNIEFDLFKEIMIFLLKECAVFSWNNCTYKQRDSLAMGSPLSPILAKILMTKLIETTLPLLRTRPRFLALYMDDSFWIAEEQDVDGILGSLNRYHGRIRFTVEREQHNQINFLDVTIIRKNDRLLHRWYKKPFASSRLLNYFSHHEKTCILETARAYVRMVFRLSDGVYYFENKVALEEILRLNSFPETEIIAIMRQNYTFMKPLPKSAGFEGKYIPIKYRGNLTQRLKYKLQPFLEKARLVGIPDKINTRHFSYLKDNIPIELKTNIVIVFSCECKKRLIVRHTRYQCRAAEVIEQVKNGHDFSDGRCDDTNHFFTDISSLQCKSYSSMKRVYNMYAYANKNKLIDTIFGLPEFRISKQIELCTKG